MGANSVTLELRAEDLGATATAERVGSAVLSLQDQIAAREQAAAVRARQHEAAVGAAERGQRKLATAIENTTNSANLTAITITRMRGLLLGLAQGAVIGAVATLAAQFFAARKNNDDLTQSVVNQGAKWDPYRSQLDAVRASTVMLYNDQLRLVKLQERDTGERLERQIAHLKTMREKNEAAASDLRRPEGNRDRFALAVAEQTIEIDKQVIKLEEWKELNGRVPLTVGEVVTSLQALQSTWSETTVSMGDTYEVWQRHEEMLTATVQARARDRALARDWEADQEILAITRAMEFRKQAEAIEIANKLGMANVLSSIAGLSASRSKALFLVGRAAAVAQSLVSAHAAAAMAAASPPGPPFTLPLAAAVLKWGYLNAAAAAAVQFATGGFSGGGGGPSGNSGPSSTPAPAREIGPSASAQPLPQTINIYIDGNLVDLSQLSRELRPYQIQLTKDTI